MLLAQSCIICLIGALPGALLLGGATIVGGAHILAGRPIMGALPYGFETGGSPRRGRVIPSPLSLLLPTVTSESPPVCHSNAVSNPDRSPTPVSPMWRPHGCHAGATVKFGFKLVGEAYPSLESEQF